jgi:hypothetical protein
MAREANGTQLTTVRHAGRPSTHRAGGIMGHVAVQKPSQRHRNDSRTAPTRYQARCDGQCDVRT